MSLPQRGAGGAGGTSGGSSGGEGGKGGALGGGGITRGKSEETALADGPPLEAETAPALDPLSTLAQITEGSFTPFAFSLLWFIMEARRVLRFCNGQGLISSLVESDCDYRGEQRDMYGRKTTGHE